MNNPVLYAPECHADTRLIRFIVKNQQLINHQHNNHKLTTLFDNPRGTNRTIIGITDFDKKNRPQLFERSFRKIEENNYFLHKTSISNSKEHVIYLKPAIERFILADVQYLKLDLSDFNLPTDFKTFCNKFKSPAIETNTGYTQLLRILEETKAPAFTALKNKITILSAL